MYQLSIQAACGLSWPQDRMIIQVLDDSTDQTTRVEELVLELSVFGGVVGGWVKVKVGRDCLQCVMAREGFLSVCVCVWSRSWCK